MAVQRVPISKEYWLVQSTKEISSIIVKDSLKEFTNQKLIDHQLTAKSTTSGLDFIGGQAYKTSLRRLFKLFLAKLEKDVPYLKTTAMVKSFGLVATSDLKVTFHLLNDKSVVRYLTRLNRQMNLIGIPLGFSTPYDQSIMMCSVDLKYNGGAGASNIRKLYYLMFFIDTIMTCLKTLQRKAIFADEHARNHFNPASTRQGLL
jgi:hypothetical protein